MEAERHGEPARALWEEVVLRREETAPGERTRWGRRASGGMEGDCPGG